MKRWCIDFMDVDGTWKVLEILPRVYDYQDAKARLAILHRRNPNLQQSVCEYVMAPNDDTQRTTYDI